MGLGDLYRNTKILKIFHSSNIANAATARATRIDTTNLSINESMVGILVVGATNLAAASKGTVTVNFLQSPSTNTASYTHIAGSSMVRQAPNTLAATPINASQRYIKGKYTVNVAGGTNLHFSLTLVGTGRILPLTT